LRKDPVASVLNSCVGCGLCGEVSDAAVLCPSFFQAEIVQNPNIMDRVAHKFRSAVIGMLQGKQEAAEIPAPQQDSTDDIRVAAE